jgi:hypothetical protein
METPETQKTVTHIRVIKVPPGEAPWEIRVQWVGLELPLAPGCSGVYSLRTAGLFDSKERSDTAIGYLVVAKDAVDILEAKSKVAAAWWRTNTPHLLTTGQRLIFNEYVCEPIETKSA